MSDETARVAMKNKHGVWWYCPGCDMPHRVTVDEAPFWTFDGNLEAPTINPSVLTRHGSEGAPVVCHCFIRAGRIEFLSDCTHELAGQTVHMVPLPDWLSDEEAAE